MERALSFGSVAEAYDRYRPELPSAVAEWWNVAHGSMVVDVAAGSGLATRTFAAAGATVISVEPDDAMRRVLSSRTPGADVRHGTGESLPVSDDSADVVTIVSAWHWLDASAAFREAARVLHNGGTLGIGWNGPDRSASWLSALFDLRRAFETGTESQRLATRVRDPRAIELPADAPFSQPDHTFFEWTWRRTADELVGWIGTYSGAIVAEDSARRGMFMAARALVERQVGKDGLIEVPMLSRCWRATRSNRDPSGR